MSYDKPEREDKDDSLVVGDVFRAMRDNLDVINEMDKRIAILRSNLEGIQREIEECETAKRKNVNLFQANLARYDALRGVSEEGDLKCLVK